MYLAPESSQMGSFTTRAERTESTIASPAATLIWPSGVNVVSLRPMKALVLKEYRQFAIEDFPVPALQPDEVLVRVRACGICGSDVHGMDGSSGRRIPPIVMGHEAAG